MDFNEKLSKLKDLTDQFHKNIKQYKSLNYDEANTRVDFIDKFFMLLDWDVTNNQGFSEQYREVVREDKIQIEGKQKAPDYSFRIGGVRKFFVEAKKPSISIKDDIEPAFQIRRYGYTAKLPLSILTDFDELAIYDTRIKPDKNDKASVGRVFFCTYEDYEKNFEFIYNTFSKNAILTGSFDKYIEENKNKKGTSEVDKELLKLVEDWRTELAKNIALRNPDIDIYNLNNAVQKIIDRIIFLRIAEDKEIENYEQLLNIVKTSENKGLQPLVYQKLNQIFLKANAKYNAGLFQPEDWLSNLIIDDKILSTIIKGLYYPECPYEFSILPIEILGNIYEQFLGKTIRFRNVKEGHTAIIEEKPEVRKAGGVYYTPQYIVNYIVENTVGEKIKNKSPEVITLLKICDPACGSGSFLVGAYSYLLNYHLDYYTKEKNIKKALKDEKIYQIPRSPFDKGGAGGFKLTIEEKQKILLNNIFGVDIDPQAVEVTKLSLYLKLLENESVESKNYLFSHSDIKLLPSLDNNIKCGNSLIGSDFYKEKDLSLFGNDDMRKVNVFDWEKEFSEIFRKRGKDVEAFHVTWVIHNSRVSERMIEYNVKRREPILFDDKSEIKITEIIKDIIHEDNLKCLAYNICGDHIHFLLVCDPDDLNNIVRKLKGKSAQKYKEYLGIRNDEEFHLWAQKFDIKEIKEDDRFVNSINYINNNRIKHDIPENKGLQPLVLQMICTYEKAFDQYEPGGFDVVIGNPPYFSLSTLEANDQVYFKKYFNVFDKTGDIYCLFFEISLKILKHKGIVGLITSNQWLQTNYGKTLRNYFVINSNPKLLVNFGGVKIFQDATVDTSIFITSKEKCDNKLIACHFKNDYKLNSNIQVYINNNKKNLSDLDSDKWIIADNDFLNLKNKIKTKGKTLNFQNINIYRGILTGYNEAFIISKELRDKLINDDPKNIEIIKPILRGRDVHRYNTEYANLWIIFTRRGINVKEYPIIESYLKTFKNKLEPGIGRKPGSYKWYEIQDNTAYYEEFNKEKLIYPETTVRRGEFYLDTDKYFIDKTCFMITGHDLKYLNAILSSSLMEWFLESELRLLGKNSIQYSKRFIENIPIPIIDNSNKQTHDQLVSLVDQMIETQKQFHEAKTDNDKKLFKQKIEIIDKQIDDLVYKLYGLTEEEIKIIEEDNGKK